MNDPLFTFSSERLDALLGGVTPQIQTPCFVYDLDLAATRFALLRSALPDRVDLAYAVKSNPGAPLLRTFAEQGAWFDCASAGEITQVLAAGGTGSSMVVAGPAKSERDLQAALYAGARVQVDGIEDVQRLDAMQGSHAPRRSEPLAVSVRVNPVGGVSERATIIGGGGPSAFGVDEEELDVFLAQAAAYTRVRVTGLQVFAASNELDAPTLLSNHATALAIGARMATDHGIDLELIDIGGGLGIPYADGEGELDIEALGAGHARLLAEHDWFTGHLLLEPGRWLSGPCGVYAARVIRTKSSRGTHFAMLEGGINHLLRPLMTGQDFPTCAVRSPEHRTDASDASGAVQDFTLAGPLCTSLDRVGTGPLPVDLGAGDVIVFGQAGAYAYTQAMTHFLSHPAPDQHWLSAKPTVSPAHACTSP